MNARYIDAYTKSDKKNLSWHNDGLQLSLLNKRLIVYYDFDIHINTINSYVQRDVE